MPIIGSVEKRRECIPPDRLCESFYLYMVIERGQPLDRKELGNRSSLSQRSICHAIDGTRSFVPDGNLPSGDSSSETRQGLPALFCDKGHGVDMIAEQDPLVSSNPKIEVLR